jgi:NAD(P)-dependent dehydrogenase (short-subunit alcohol dehydrogenase family)
MVGRYHEVHVHPKGPGDARPTALQIVKDEGLEGKMTDKVIFVTGASSGIGIETARALHVTGATVFMGVRDVKKGHEIVNEILSSDANNKAPMHVIGMTLDSFTSVRAAATEFLKQSNKLNILVLNAGVMATPLGRTVEGFETQFGTNHLGHFLLFQLLKQTLLASSTPDFNSRVVSVASAAHRFGPIRFHDYNFEEQDSYQPYIAYGQSKTANIYLANYIDRHYGPKGLHATSLHPGGIRTALQRHRSADEMKQWDQPSIQDYFKSPEQGAATSVYAALSKEWEGKGGKYLSNCEVMGPAKGPGLDVGDDGYAEWAYNEADEDRLWRDSCKFVGAEED